MIKDIEKRKAYQRIYQKAKYDTDPIFREKMINANRKNQKIHHLLNKARAFEILGGVQCKKCGITDIRILTINHIEHRNRNDWYDAGRGLYWAISKGNKTKEELENLEVLCFNCNILYEYETGARVMPELDLNNPVDIKE